MRLKQMFTGPRLATTLMALAVTFLIWLLVFAYTATADRNREVAEQAKKAARENKALVERIEGLAMDIKAIEEFNRGNLISHRKDNRHTHNKLLRKIGNQHARLLEAMGIEPETARTIFRPGLREVEIVHVHHHHPGPVRHEHHHHHHHHKRCDNEGTQAAQNAGGPECK